MDRFHCAHCGSPIGARFDYLPGQFFVPIGLFDDAASLPPDLHSHMNHCLPWLKIDDDLPRESASAREQLQGAIDRE